MAKKVVPLRLHPEFIEAATLLASFKDQTLAQFIEEAVCRAIAHHPDLPAEERTEMVERSIERFKARLTLEGYDFG